MLCANTELFAPYLLGNLWLRNRVIMAPMTRCRATEPGEAPTALMAEYYAQRASAGLIISEGVPTSERARGYLYTPGIYSDAQVAGWQQVTAAVHEREGRIFAQLWHCGRISHPSLRADRALPVGPSSQISQNIFTFALNPEGQPGNLPCGLPHRLTTEEAAAIPGEFATAAARARDAGFDGVEIHGANGYLFDQFRSGAVNNERDDAYGGCLENRCRLLLETVDAVVAVLGPDRVGVRLSPFGSFNDIPAHPDDLESYLYLANQLDRRGIAYIHLNDQAGEWVHDASSPVLKGIRSAFRRALILCGNFDLPKALHAAGRGDLVAFGRPFIANPNLIARWQYQHPLLEPDPKTFYAGGATGYTDYPC
ncbi:MAG: hypothetical protein RIR00_790 [Pseudomonadota bacterium]